MTKSETKSPKPGHYKFDPWPAEEWFRDNEVAHLVRAGYNVLVFCLHGDNSDYVRMNGMGWPDAGFVYGLHFDYGASETAAQARYDLMLACLAQHRHDAIAFQWKDASGKQRLTVYRLTHGELPTMNELMGIDDEDD